MTKARELVGGRDGPPLTLRSWFIPSNSAGMASEAVSKRESAAGLGEELKHLETRVCLLCLLLLLYSDFSPRLEPFLLHLLFTLFCFSDMSKGGLVLRQPRQSEELSRCAPPGLSIKALLQAKPQLNSHLSLSLAALGAASHAWALTQHNPVNPQGCRISECSSK